MGIVIEIPSALKQYVKNNDLVAVEGNLIEDAIKNLCSDYPELKQNLFDQNGELHGFINIYINDNDIRYSEGMKSKLKNGDTIQIVPSLAGGTSII